MTFRSTIIYLVSVVLSFCADIAHGSVFSDTFEADIAGTFPTNWTHFNPTWSTATVVDETLAPGAIFDGDQSLRINFLGGVGSGVTTTFPTIVSGVVSFESRIDSASDDLQLMGLWSSPNLNQAGDQLFTIVAAPDAQNNWTYRAWTGDTSVPVAFGQYTHFDLYFDTEASTASLYINGVLTNVADAPLANASAGVTTLSSRDDSGPGAAQWFLDNVSVTVDCDFDSDGDCDADDADALTGVGNLPVGIPIPPAHPKFDITNDNIVDASDLTEWRDLVGVVNEFGGPVKLGDTNVDNDVDTDDLTRAIINYTGAGATSKVWSQGDNDGDGDTDTVDLTTAITNFTGVEAANPNVPDLVYDPATGNVTIDADGADVISFSLQSGPFNAADFSDLPAGLTDNITTQIGWTSFNLFTGLTGAANLGAILPAGLDLAELEAALQIASYGLALSTGGGGGTFDLIIPEPASVMLIGLGATTLRCRRRAA